MDGVLSTDKNINRIPEPILNIECGEWNKKTDEDFEIIRNFFHDYLCERIDIEYLLGKLDIKDIENYLRKEKIRKITSDPL